MWRNTVLALSLTLNMLFVFGLTLHFVGVTGAVFSDSEPRGLYRTTSGPVTRGAIVELGQLSKHVAGVPGDTIRVTPEGSYVNGELWPNSAPICQHYKPVPFGTYKLGPGQYWLLGRNPSSWDSRYAGFIPWDLIYSTITPVWTISNGYAPGTRPWK